MMRLNTMRMMLALVIASFFLSGSVSANPSVIQKEDQLMQEASQTFDKRPQELAVGAAALGDPYLDHTVSKINRDTEELCRGSRAMQAIRIGQLTIKRSRLVYQVAQSKGYTAQNYKKATELYQYAVGKSVPWAEVVSTMCSESWVCEIVLVGALGLGLGGAVAAVAIAEVVGFAGALGSAFVWERAGHIRYDADSAYQWKQAGDNWENNAKNQEKEARWAALELNRVEVDLQRAIVDYKNKYLIR